MLPIIRTRGLSKLKNNISIKLLVFIFLICNLAFAQRKRPLPKRGVGKDFFKYISKIKDPFNLRDPFKSPLKRQTLKKRKTLKTGYRDGNTLRSGSRVNWSTIPLTQLTITGVIIGENRRALVTTPATKNVQILKEGMRVGPDNAILKAILPSGVIFVEKIVNVYGQEEYLETVIPLSR